MCKINVQNVQNVQNECANWTISFAFWYVGLDIPTAEATLSRARPVEKFSTGFMSVLFPLLSFAAWRSSGSSASPMATASSRAFFQFL
jgi:hypothetical protein